VTCVGVVPATWQATSALPIGRGSGVTDWQASTANGQRRRKRQLRIRAPGIRSTVFRVISLEELARLSPVVWRHAELDDGVPRILERISWLRAALSASAELVLAHEGPIVGATILGLDAVGAGPEAIDRARAELQQAIAEVGRQPVA
jgi:hypothetical protein